MSGAETKNNRNHNEQAQRSPNFLQDDYVEFDMYDTVNAGFKLSLFNKEKTQ